MKRLPKIVGLLVLLLVIPGLAPAAAAQSANLYEQGLELQKAGKWQDASPPGWPRCT